ncbi:hypothetical protein ACJX0J_016899, partial [Zea mays]
LNLKYFNLCLLDQQHTLIDAHIPLFLKELYQFFERTKTKNFQTDTKLNIFYFLKIALSAMSDVLFLVPILRASLSTSSIDKDDVRQVLNIMEQRKYVKRNACLRIQGILEGYVILKKRWGNIPIENKLGRNATSSELTFYLLVAGVIQLAIVHILNNHTCTIVLHLDAKICFTSGKPYNICHIIYSHLLIHMFFLYHFWTVHTIYSMIVAQPESTSPFQHGVPVDDGRSAENTFWCLKNNLIVFLLLNIIFNHTFYLHKIFSKIFKS